MRGLLFLVMFPKMAESMAKDAPPVEFLYLLVAFMCAALAGPVTDWLQSVRAPKQG